MAHQYHWQEKGLLRVYTGKMTGDEVFESNLQLHGDARFDVIDYVINDFTQVIDFEVNEEDITKIAIVDNVASKSKPILKIAIVATLAPLLGWINMYLDAMQGASYECKIFSNTDDAYAWVNVPL